MKILDSLVIYPSKNQRSRESLQCFHDQCFSFSGFTAFVFEKCSKLFS